MTEGNGVGPAGVLTPLRRNRFFYGKLMDTRHWELEQDYGIQSRRLVNRLGLGAGILCGLGVRIADGGAVCVAPGVAVDACGREIVVTETVALAHVDQPTDECGQPAGDPVRDGDVTIWLCYHECGSEFTRIANGDCGHREVCVPGLLDERFALRIGAGATDHAPGLSPETCATVFPGDPQGPPRRQVVAGLLAGPCSDPADCCVPLATVHVDDGGAATAVGLECRTYLYSNEELFDLLMCLAARVEQCCHAHPAALAPRVMDAWPPLKGEIPDDDLRGFFRERRLELVFEREMRDLGLDQPDSWLGVWQVTTDGVARLPLTRTGGTFTHVSPQGGQEGVAYDVGVDGERNPEELAFVVMMRASAGGDIVARDDGAALDADFAGTGLTAAERDELWKLAPDGSVQPIAVRDHVLLASSPALPSGDAAEGGELHGAAARAAVVPVPSPPQLLSVYPAGATVLAKQDAATFGERPRLELTVSRAIADAALGDAAADWVRAYTTNRDGAIYGFNRIKTEPASAVSNEDGTATITLGLDPAVFQGGAPEVLVVLRPGAAAAGQEPVGAEEPHDLLDADFNGTSLDKQTVITIFDGGATDPIANLDPISTEGATLSDGAPGGLVHYAFQVEVPVAPPPQLVAFWPPRKRLAANDPQTAQDARSFVERPRLELKISRPIADASLQEIGAWLRAFTANRDGELIYGFNPLVATVADVRHDAGGEVTITVELPERDRFEPFQAEVLVIMRPDAAPPGLAPIGADPPPDLLDADLAGTALGEQSVMTIFDGGGIEPIKDIDPLPTEGAPLHDGAPGGLAHLSFVITRAAG